MRICRQLLRGVYGIVAILTVVSSVFAQYSVFVGDRDQQQGVWRFDPSTNSASVFGGCPANPPYRFYYGLEIDRGTGKMWVCDVLAEQLVCLDSNGNCLGTFSTSAYGRPHGLSIDPSRQYLNVSFCSATIACFDMTTNQFIGSTTIPGASCFYGIQWIGGLLFACDFWGQKIYALSGDPWNLSVVAVSDQTPYNPYDVTGYIRTGGRAPIVHLFVTYSQGYYGSYSEIAYAQYALDTPGFLPVPSTFVAHPNNGQGAVSFFGITYEPSDQSLWVSDYVRGTLYQVTGLANPTVTQRYAFGGKVGVGIDTNGPSCQPHNGDVNQDACVDDADLLAVLFAFGSSGPNLGRVDVNCDGIVDDADLLTVLFNFGGGC